MRNIKKGYLPYLIGEIACCACEVILLFIAMSTDFLPAVILALIAVAITGAGVGYAYNKSKIAKTPARPEKNAGATKKKKRRTRGVSACDTVNYSPL